MESKQKLPNQIVGNIGMYYVCYRLSQLGFNVMPTARNARGIDIVAYSKEGDKFLGIQVKTFSKPCAIPLGKNKCGMEDTIWCIVVGQKSGEPKVFVMTQEEVSSRATQDHKGRNWWVEYKTFGKTDEFLEKWDRISGRLS